TKEVRAILPVDLPLIDEPDVHLVHKGRRLQGMVSPLAPKLAGRNASELRIDERQQLVQRSPVAATPIGEQRRDVARRDHRSLLQSIGKKPKHSTGRIPSCPCPVDPFWPPLARSPIDGALRAVRL